jgi:single-strand DNA-binding protein
MSSVNKVILIGRLGKDPETRTTNNGGVVAKFSLATDEQWTDKQGEKQKRTEWTQIEVWGKPAEAVGKFLKKGSQVYVEGSLRTDSWEDKNSGDKKYQTLVNAQRVQFLDAKKADGTNDSKPPVEDDSEVPF